MAEDLRERAEMIQKGTRHCQRAYYDVCEISAAYHIEIIKIFQRDFSLYPVSRVIPEYTAYLTVKDEAIKFLGQNSMHADEPKVHEIAEFHTKLAKAANHLEAARPEVVKNIRWWQAGALVAAITLAATVAATIIAYFD